ncbi:MAG: class I SAM-dependent RNA methyltransferase [Treponema sp.]|jgi:putative N6-adenine-specific DNA methylase|nr:class I SAM-dependent RNA methyltransferase [Treponema sp.]
MEKIENVAALCAVGAEKAVSNELRKLDLKVEESLYGRVRFKANTAGLYRALIGLRAADRVLLEAASFKAEDFDDLFERANAAEWERIVPKGLGLKVVKVRANRSRLKAETSIQSVVHKAAAQRLCGKYGLGRLPEDGKAAEVRVYIEKDMVSLLVDLSGEPLFKRGYRSEGGTAPLRETTAAAMLLLSGWKRKFPLYDPFCGSGTILLEAAMYAWDMAPGLGRRFALEELLIADSKIEQDVRHEFRGKIDFERLVRIAGSDEDVRSVSIASSNAARLLDIAAGKTPQRGIRPVADKRQEAINIKVMRIGDVRSPFPDTEGFLITNPPYGKRLGDPAQSEQTYREMGNLGQHFPGWKLALITDHGGFESFFGKKADSCREISNGAIPSYFYQYESQPVVYNYL